jgi:copper chaperone
MRKAFVMAVALLAVMAFSVAPIFACGNKDAKAEKASADAKYTCSSKKADAEKANVEMVSSKSGCTAADGAKAAMVSVHADEACICPAMAAKDCAAKMGMTVEECMALCKSGDLTMVSMNVEGMTCGGCEKSIKAALMKVPGVVTVKSVDYKSGTAVVYLDTRKGESNDVVTAVTNKGYKAEIIPAVATMDTESKTETANVQSKSCTASKSACTGVHKTEAKQVSAEGTK